MNALEGKPLEDITEADLLQLITDKEQEKKTIDYKRDAIGNADKDKKEFLADVSSFANASGGHLVIGMDETNGIPMKLTGINVGIDAEKLRLTNILKTGIDPRIPGIDDMRAVPLNSGSSGDNALVIRIPRSWQSPHMITFKGSSKFYSRTSAGKFPLSVDEIRAAFLLSETAADRIRNFRAERISNIISGETPISMEKGSKAVFHAVPLSSSELGKQVDLEPLLKSSGADLYAKLHPLQYTHKRRNFDGVLAYLSGRDASTAEWYVQLFRNSCVEFTISFGEYAKEEIPATALEEYCRRAYHALVSIVEYLNVEPPIFVMLSVLGVRDCAIEARRQSRMIHQVHRIEHENLLLPEVVVESLSDDVDEVMKPLFDIIWNAAGWPRSPNYDRDGNWNAS